MTTQNKCCERCRGPLVFTPEPNIVGCMDTGCPCHTQKKSIREEFEGVVSEEVKAAAKYPLATTPVYDIMSAFDSALEAIIETIDAKGTYENDVITLARAKQIIRSAKEI